MLQHWLGVRGSLLNLPIRPPHSRSSFLHEIIRVACSQQRNVSALCLGSTTEWMFCPFRKDTASPKKLQAHPSKRLLGETESICLRKLVICVIRSVIRGKKQVIRVIRWSKENQTTLSFLNPRITRITYFLPRITDQITRITALWLLLRSNDNIFDARTP